MENFNIDDYIDDRITIYSMDDPDFGHIEVCEGYYLGDHMRFLLVDDAMQSACFTDEDIETSLPFDYMESFNWVYRINKHIKKTLLIGGGGFTYPRYYLDMYPDRYIDTIEISPTIVDISRKYFGLTELEEKYGEHLKVIVEDGNKYLIDLALRIKASASNTSSEPPAYETTSDYHSQEYPAHETASGYHSQESQAYENASDYHSQESQAYEAESNSLSPGFPASDDSGDTPVSTDTANRQGSSLNYSAQPLNDLKYDLILNDAYVGHKSSDLLKKSAALIKSCLREDGIYAANLVIPLKGNGAVQPKKDMEIFSEVFNYTFLFQCDDEINPYVPQNCIFFASDAPLDM